MLPCGYGQGVLQGDEAVLAETYLEAVNDTGTWTARWAHPALRKGRQQRRPGYCPGSDYNPLQPRTDEELGAIKRKLAAYGLENAQLIDDTGRIAAGRLVVADALHIAEDTLYQDRTWQKLALAT